MCSCALAVQLACVIHGFGPTGLVNLEPSRGSSEACRACSPPPMASANLRMTLKRKMQVLVFQQNQKCCLPLKVILRPMNGEP